MLCAQWLDQFTRHQHENIMLSKASQSEVVKGRTMSLRCWIYNGREQKSKQDKPTKSQRHRQ